MKPRDPLSIAERKHALLRYTYPIHTFPVYLCTCAHTYTRTHTGICAHKDEQRALLGCFIQRLAICISFLV